MQEGQSIALTLSGGGIRAMMFHLGVLQALAETGRLERVSHISTVSGGSLLLGLILHENNLCWPTSGEYLAHVQPALRSKLCSRSMMLGALCQLLYPGNWRYLFSRANLLARTLEYDWGIKAALTELPPIPDCAINGTTAETGKRFDFKAERMGDYTLGYARPTGVKLATVMAVSAAFPVGFGPLAMATAPLTWFRWPSSDSGQLEELKPEWPTLHLYDGGVYDNLGLEAFLDVGASQLKVPVAQLIVSDAGAPLRRRRLLPFWNPFRIERLMDIVTDQVRALRVRNLHGFMRAHPGQAAYIYIANPALLRSDPDAGFAAGYPTSLNRPSRQDYDRVEQYGYRCAQHVLSHPAGDDWADDLEPTCR